MTTPFEKLKEEVRNDFEAHVRKAFSRADIPDYAWDAILPIVGGINSLIDRIAKEVAEAGMVEENNEPIDYAEHKLLYHEVAGYNLARSESIRKLKEYGIDV